MKENPQRCLPELALALMLCMGTACADDVLDTDPSDETGTGELAVEPSHVAPGAHSSVERDGSNVAESHGERETITPNRRGPAAVDSDEHAARMDNEPTTPPTPPAASNNR